MLVQKDIDSFLQITICENWLKKSDYFVSKKTFKRFINCKIKRLPKPTKQGYTHKVYAHLTDEDRAAGKYPRQLGWGTEYLYDSNKNINVQI